MYLRSFMSIFFIALQLMTIGLAVAQSEPTSTPPLDSGMLTPVPPYATWEGSFRLRAGVPFAWLRQDPFSTGAVVATVPAGGAVQALVGANAEQVYDGTQWWGYVISQRGQGWVELNSLELVPNLSLETPNAVSPQNWQVNNVVRVKASVPFAWIRSDMNGDASSAGDASNILGTYPSGTRFVIVAGANLGRQIWWQVRDPNSTTVGFVEQSSLEFVRSRPNFTVSPLPPSSWRSGFSLRLKPSLPFLWIRSAPNSNAGIVYTIQRGGEVVLSGTDVQNDGVQNWRQVSLGNAPINGWVEENALQFSRIWTQF